MKPINEELLHLLEQLLRAQLKAIRKLRKDAGLPEVEKPKERRMSQMDIVFNLLKAAGHPMHIQEIIEAANKRFDKQLDRESLVSALIKRVNRKDRFIKTGPNTFALLPQEQEGGGR